MTKRVQARANPWIEPPAEPATGAPEQPVIIVRARPRRLSGIPAIQNGLARRRLSRAERLLAVWLVGAHGGAGISTIAGVMEHVGDAGVAWPIAEDPEPARVVLVARESYTGLSAARRALTEWVGGQVPVQLEGLLLVAAQPGGPPRQLRELIALVRSQANGAVWRLGWQPAWLTGPPAAAANKTLQEMHKALLASEDPRPPKEQHSP